MARNGFGEQIDHLQIEILKPLVLKALEWYDEHTPKLTELNTTHNKNTLHMIDLSNWFFDNLDCPSREKALRGLAKFIIIHFDFDAPYREMMLAVLRKALDYKWVWDNRKPHLFKEI